MSTVEYLDTAGSGVFGLSLRISQHRFQFLKQIFRKDPFHFVGSGFEPVSSDQMPDSNLFGWNYVNSEAGL